MTETLGIPSRTHCGGKQRMAQEGHTALAVFWGNYKLETMHLGPPDSIK